ncbi:LysR family transcriptional regulator [Devosia ginsengisoli]|uniref:LysR family transcriptional regulator n=1 Tax=Devosia ginsengisoli TaxID=400770 RepID=UPI0026EEFE86|nr:LysR family transcriptional regulator [Devosia ginsengisoli]MCR6670065.1 LysR family transcriptional regulator [Devosia ginsengisoli]
MDLNWIEDFRTLVETRSFSLSARRRSISQSAFSKRIRSLERVFGGELVQRKHLPVTLTPLGEQLYRDSEAIAESVRLALENAAQLEGKGQNEVMFSSASSLAQSFYPQWITRKKTLMSEIIPLMLSSRSWSEDGIALQQGQVDFFLSYCSPEIPTVFDRPEFDFRVLGLEQIVPVSAPSANGREPLFSLDREGIEPMPYLARLPGSYIGHMVDMLIERLHPPTVRAFAGTNGENLLGLLIHGNGISWMPQNRIGEQLAKGTLLPAGGARWQLEVEVRLYRRARRERPIVEKFWNSISQRGDEFPDRAV